MYRYLTILGLFCMVSCEKSKKLDDRLIIQNNSEINIMYIPSKDYPDTVSFAYSACPIDDISYFVGAGKKKPYIIFANWEDEINNFKNKTMMIFIVSDDTARKYGNCDSLKSKSRILKRFDVTVDYLNAHDWTLTYP